MKIFAKSLVASLAMALGFFSTMYGQTVPPVQEVMKMANCEDMSTDMKDFADKLTPANRMKYCSTLSDNQRKQAMEMAAKKDSYGKPMMTPDQAVEQVATQSKMTETPSSSY